eukprot:COSAG02_NODE_5669_length_4142_cov_2.620084_2_plen_215_part_00
MQPAGDLARTFSRRVAETHHPGQHICGPHRSRSLACLQSRSIAACAPAERASQHHRTSAGVRWRDERLYPSRASSPRARRCIAAIHSPYLKVHEHVCLAQFTPLARAPHDEALVPSRFWGFSFHGILRRLSRRDLTEAPRAVRPRVCPPVGDAVPGSHRRRSCRRQKPCISVISTGGVGGCRPNDIVVLGFPMVFIICFELSGQFLFESYRNSL